MYYKKEEGNSYSSIFLKSRRGQGLSTNAIILIILGVIILAVLILGFTVGWSKILPFISINNVDNIATACNVACVTNSQFDFCNVGRDLKADDVTLNDVTCNYLAEKQKVYRIEECPSITCEGITLADGVALDNAKGDCKGKSEGDIVQYLEDKTLKSYTCTTENI